MIYEQNISPEVLSENLHELYKVAISTHAIDSSADKTFMADFQRLLESTLTET